MKDFLAYLALFVGIMAMFGIAFIMGEIQKAHRRVFWGAVLYGVIGAFKKKPVPPSPKVGE